MDPFVLQTLRKTKKVTIIVVGFTLLLIGIAMIVLPGPAFIMIPIALGILGTELVWAKSFLKKIKSKFLKQKKKE